MVAQSNEAWLESLLHTKIPISKAMDIRVESLSPMELIMTLPIDVNHNHKGTVFGGSLYSGSACACYGLFLWGLREAAFATEDLVIAEGHIRYLKPVGTDARIVACWPEPSSQSEFFKSLQQKGKARIEMKAKIFSLGEQCAEFSGIFVAKDKPLDKLKD